MIEMRHLRCTHLSLSLSLSLLILPISLVLKSPAEPILPGLALPEAFESLDKRIESTVQFCRLKGSVESQILGLVTVCQEMQRLLKFAFIGKLTDYIPPSLFSRYSVCAQIYPDSLYFKQGI